ncbi:MAG: flavodoxin domain-containing protein [Treponema sp.]|nr:flavodoxin domain-containing protein [Treponema sp.]
MVKVLVLYFTIYGSTKKYAEWIAEELKGDLFDINDVRYNQLYDYDIIILGGGLYAGNIKGLNLLIDNYEKIKNKKLIIFTCGLADYSKEENINSVKSRLKKNTPNNVFENIKVFYLRGYINYKKLSFKHRIMMGMMRKMILIKGAEKMNEENKEFLETYGKIVDFTDKKNIKEIIDYCNK